MRWSWLVTEKRKKQFVLLELLIKHLTTWTSQNLEMQRQITSHIPKIPYDPYNHINDPYTHIYSIYPYKWLKISSAQVSDIYELLKISSAQVSDVYVQMQSM